MGIFSMRLLKNTWYMNNAYKMKKLPEQDGLVTKLFSYYSVDCLMAFNNSEYGKQFKSNL
jgi:hypothetical protein